MSSQLIQSLPSRDKEALKLMAKALPKDSIRSYGTVIGFVGGKAYISDGFGLLELTLDPSFDQSASFSLTRDLFDSQVKFPSVDGAMPESGVVLSSDVLSSFLELPMALGKKELKGLRLFYQRHRVSLSLESAWPEGALAFNPWVIRRYIEALPKGSKVTSGLINDGTLRLFIESGDQKFSIVICEVKKP
jgi:hypothetical protein